MIETLLKELTYDAPVRRPLEEVPDTIVVGGMGGSGMVGDALSFLFPKRQIFVHRGYGLPHALPPGALYVAISYSGNTEETVSFANEAMRQRLPLAVVASGGALGTFADREQLPFASVPTGLAPRNALIYTVRALLTLLTEEAALRDLASVVVDPTILHETAEADAHFLVPSVPLLYSSERNVCLSRIGKMVLNETARMPAFANVFPELNHNEMQSYDTAMPPGLVHLFRFVIFRDEEDDARIQRRIDTFTSLMEERGNIVHMIELSGTREAQLATTWIRLLLAGRLLAETRDLDPDAAPLIESFKKLL